MQLKPIAYAERVRTNAGRDIIDSPFDFAAASQLLLSSKQEVREVCDAVMDQAILPGVGNVIKCEGLFRTRIHPQTLMQDLSEVTCRRLVRNLRDFAIHWYNCCKTGKKVNKLVYGLSSCSACRGEINLIRSGDLSRISYFCARCQHFGAAANQATANSLAGLFAAASKPPSPPLQRLQ